MAPAFTLFVALCGVEYSGTVYAADGSPAVGIEVLICGRSDNIPLYQLALATGATGRYAADIPEGFLVQSFARTEATISDWSNLTLTGKRKAPFKTSTFEM